jgi:thiol-disulfide isomerase/thioredoxin
MLSNVSFAEGINFQDLRLEEALEKAKKENKKVFIDVFTTWCGPCKVLDKYVFQTKGVGDRMNAEYVSIKVDAENSPDQLSVLAYGIEAYPTMLILDGDGNEVHRIVGSLSVESFHNELDSQLAPEFQTQNIALKALESNPEDEAIWRENLLVLMNRDYDKFKDYAQPFVDEFGLNELNNELDSAIFYYAILPVDGPIVQRILTDREFMNSSYDFYAKREMMERARTAKTEEEFLVVKAEADALYEQHVLDSYGDYVDEKSFMSEIFPDDLNPMYLQEAVVDDTTIETIESVPECNKRKKKRNKRRCKRLTRS